MSYWRTKVADIIFGHLARVLTFLVVGIGIIWFLLGSAPCYIRILATLSVLILISLVYFNVCIIATLADIRDILDESLSSKMSNPSNPNPNRRREEKIRTSGAGALAGMTIGGLLGLPFGFPGVLIGGILGAIIGDQIEYEYLKSEKERRRR